MAKLLIFDFDGTLCDTGPSIHTAVNQALVKMGLKELPRDQVLNFIGGGFEQLAAKAELDSAIGKGQIPEFRKIFFEEYDKVYLDNSHPFDGVVEFLENWQNDIAIASNKTVSYIHSILEKDPLNKFNWKSVYGGKCFPNKKPEPDMIHKILEETGYSPEEAVMIGDGQPDVLVAKNSGLKSIAVSFGYCSPEELKSLGADTVIDHFSELPSAINKLFP